MNKISKCITLDVDIDKHMTMHTDHETVEVNGA